MFNFLLSHVYPQPISGPATSGIQPPTITAPPTTSGPPKPVFPAYQQQPPGPSGIPNSVAGPGGVPGDAAAAPMAPTLPEINRRPDEKVPSVGPGCKLMHPEDDLSLVSQCMQYYY